MLGRPQAAVTSNLLLRGGREQLAEFRAELLLVKEDVSTDADARDLAPSIWASEGRLGERRPPRGFGNGKQFARVKGHRNHLLS